jgi:tetratricopeptide (TPR) repeat protein
VGLEEAPVRALLGVLVALFALGLRPWTQEPGGNRAYRKGDYARAVERYRAVMARRGAEPRLNYNLGTALLQLGESDLAHERLSHALDARSPELRARVFYNLGNALIRRTGARDAGNLRAAIDAYRRSLLLDPTRDDARWNLELAWRRLEQLESSQPSSTDPESPPVSPAGEPGDVQEGLRGEPSPSGAAGSGSRLLNERAEGGAADVPLTRELAEQILRAVEERERALQRDKLRRERRQTRGPDW